MRFAFEKPTIRIYKYYFLGLSEPILIQAYNKVEARATMKKVAPKLPQPYQESKVIGETVTVPVYGITERKDGGKDYVWVGKEQSATCWMEKSEFEKKYAN